MGDLLQHFFFWLFKIEIIDWIVNVEENWMSQLNSLQRLVDDVKELKRQTLVISKANLLDLLKVISINREQRMKTLDQKQRETENLKKQVARLSKQCEACLLKDSMIEQFKNIQSSVKDVKKFVGQHVEGLGSKIESEMKEMKEMKGRANKIEKNKDQKREFEDIKDQLKSLSEHFVSLSEKYDDVLSKQEARSSQIKSAIDCLASQNQSEVKSIKESIQKSNIEGSKRSKETKETKTDDFIVKMEKLLSQLNERAETASKNDRDEIQRLITGKNQLIQENQSLHQVLLVEKTKNDDLQAQINQNQKDNESKQKIIQREKEEFVQKINDLTKEKEREVTKLQENIQELTDKLDLSQNNISQLRNQIKNLTQRLTRSQNEIRHNATKNQANESTIKEKDEKISNLNKLLNDEENKRITQEKCYKEQIQAEKSRGSAMQGQLNNKIDTLNTLIREKQDALEKSKNENSLLKAQIEKLNNQLEKANTRINELSNSLNKQQLLVKYKEEQFDLFSVKHSEQIDTLVEQNEALVKQIRAHQALPPSPVIERNFAIYFQNQVLSDFVDYKRQMINHLQNQYQKAVNRTRMVYRWDPLNTINFHKYVDYIPNLAIIVRLKENRFIAAFTNQCFKKQNGYYGNQSFIYSLHNNTVFGLREGRKAITYDDFYLIVGNSEFRLRHGEKKLFSNFGIASSYINNNGKAIDHLFGEGKINEVAIEYYEIYHVIFEGDEELEYNAQWSFISTSSVSSLSSSIY